MAASDVDGDGSNDSRTFTVTVNPNPTGPGDYSDAPDTFGTLTSSRGAWHIVAGDWDGHLGATASSDVDGMPSPNADADSNDDGVVFGGPFIPGQPNFMDITATQPGAAHIFIDLNNDGKFDYSDLAGLRSEYISPFVVGNRNPDSGFGPLLIPAGTTRVQLPVLDFPPNANSAIVRVRFSRDGVLNPFAGALNGEVEDYRVAIGAQAIDPTLRYHLSTGGDLLLDFTGFLDSAPEVTGPWTRRATQSPFTVDPNVGMMFFRASSE